MKMLYKYMSETVNIEDTGAILLVIEDKHLFRKTVLSVYHNNEDELFVFSENYKPLDFAKNIRFVDNILTFEFADKKLMTKVLVVEDEILTKGLNILKDTFNSVV